METDTTLNSTSKIMINDFLGYLYQFKEISSHAKYLFDHQFLDAHRHITSVRESIFDTFVSTTADTIKQQLHHQKINLFVNTVFHGCLKKAPNLLEHQDILLNYIESVAVRLGYIEQIDMICQTCDVELPHPPNELITEKISTSFFAKLSIRSVIKKVLERCNFKSGFEDLERDIIFLDKAISRIVKKQNLGLRRSKFEFVKAPFFRNKAAYLIGRLISAEISIPFIIPVLAKKSTNKTGNLLYIDAFISEEKHLNTTFAMNNNCFFVEHNSPKALVFFLRKIFPTFSKDKLYNIIGYPSDNRVSFEKKFKNHLRRSDDLFDFASDTKGMAMEVFTLPSLPFVYKLVKDPLQAGKDTNKSTIKEHFLFAKMHDITGRLADTILLPSLEIPLKRIAPSLLRRLQKKCKSSISNIKGGTISLRDIYVETRIEPLNKILKMKSPVRKTHHIKEFVSALNELCSSNIFPGDILFKNFGLTIENKVIFFDYDETSPLLNVNFRKIPLPMYPEQELAEEPWYAVGPDDVFPEEFLTFFTTDKEVRNYLKENYSEIFSIDYWKTIQNNIRKGEYKDFFPYPKEIRFKRGI